jgi:hypothetical protein
MYCKAFLGTLFHLLVSENADSCLVKVFGASEEGKGRGGTKRSALLYNPNISSFFKPVKDLDT